MVSIILGIGIQGVQAELNKEFSRKFKGSKRMKDIAKMVDESKDAKSFENTLCKDKIYKPDVRGFCTDLNEFRLFDQICNDVKYGFKFSQTQCMKDIITTLKTENPDKPEGWFTGRLHVLNIPEELKEHVSKNPTHPVSVFICDGDEAFKNKLPKTVKEFFKSCPKPKKPASPPRPTSPVPAKPVPTTMETRKRSAAMSGKKAPVPSRAGNKQSSPPARPKAPPPSKE